MEKLTEQPTAEQQHDVPCIVVKDTRKAFLDLAAYFRSKFRVLVTGVTGSVGKTMTKEMVFLAMSSKHICMKTLENKNNEIGLPFTLLNRLDRTKTMAVIEMGMSYFGEISRLSHTAKPDMYHNKYRLFPYRKPWFS